MTRRYVFGAAIAALIIASGAFAVRGSAQAQTPSGTDVLPALLQEVHGLRVAMEQATASSAHAQLLVGRLQLQETRMSGMIRRLDTVRDSLTAARTTYDQMSGALKHLGDDSAADVPQQDKDGLLAGLKGQVANAKANVDRLAAEEIELTSELTSEQARWVDINQRLDELERSLTRR